MTKKNSDIFITHKPLSANPQIISLNSNDELYNKIIEDLNFILTNDMLQPQMITDTKYYMQIYDDNFSYQTKNQIKKYKF